MSAPARHDVDLVRRAQQGDREAFSELFNRLDRPVLNYVYHMLGDRQAAEDITQEAFLRAHERIGQLGPPWDFKSWVYRIASNLAVDLVRGERRWIEVEEVDDVAEPPTTRRPMERKVQREETRRGVRKTLDGLPTAYRQALILRELNGLSYEEVARALECTHENARQLVHRARLRFRELHGLRLMLAGGVGRCRELGELLSGYHDGELGDRERRLAEAHLKTCAECSEARDDMRKVGALLASLAPLVPSASWEAKVLQEVSRRAPQAALPGGGPPPPPPPAGGLAGFLASGTGKAILAAVVAAPLLLVGAVAIRLLSMRSLSRPTPTSAPTAMPATRTPAASPTRATTLSVAASPTPMPVAATEPSTPTPTPTLGLPLVTAYQETNCRSGPGTTYDAVGFLHSGDSSPIEGRNAESSWWWIRQVSGVGHCWVWGDGVRVSGDTSQVPVVPSPPTPTPPDTQPPMVSIVHSPTGSFRPDDRDRVTFMATASDERAVARIEIWVRAPGSSAAVLVRTCVNATSCIVQGGPYPAGTGEYFSRAWDTAGNMAESLKIPLIVFQSLI